MVPGPTYHPCQLTLEDENGEHVWNWPHQEIFQETLQLRRVGLNWMIEERSQAATI